MLHIAKLCLFLMTMSCVSTSELSSLKRPAWMNQTSEYCEAKGLVCGSAEASSAAKADLLAKGQLAAIFETYIESEVVSEKSLTSQNNMLADFDLKERINKEVREKVSILLTGVSISEREQSGENYYSLASIDRLLTIKTLRDEISKHDERLEYLYSQKKKTNLTQMYDHYLKREAYNQKLTVLSSGVKSPVSLNELDELKSSLITKGSRLLFDTDSLDAKIADQLRANMASLGYQLVLPGSDFDYKILGEMKKQKEYFKVKGFEQISFNINLRSFNPKGVELGGIHIERKGIGRSESDAFKQIENEVINYINTHLDDLRIGE